MSGQLEHAPIPSVARSPQTYIALEIARAEGRECGFACRWDASEQMVTTARLVMRGRRDQVHAVDLRPEAGEVLFLHNHPSATTLAELEPSPDDLTVAGQMARDGIGFGLVTNRADGLYLVTAPPVPRLRAGVRSKTLELFRKRLAIIVLWRANGKA